MAIRQQSGTEMITTYGLVMFLVTLAIVVVLLLVSAPPAIAPKSCSIYGGLQCADIAYGSNVVSGSVLLVRATFAVPGALNISSFNAVVGGVKSTNGYCTTNGVSSGNSMMLQGSSILCVAYFPTNSSTSAYFGTFNVSANYCTGPTDAACPRTKGYVFAGSWSAEGGKPISTSYISQLAANLSPSTTTSSTTTTTTISPQILITLTNSQGTSTGSNFQQMIKFNPSSYSSNEAADLGNIRFSQSGTALYSWCESGCNTSSSSAVFWVKLPSGIGSNANVVLNMTFQSTSTDYDGVYAGLAPTASNSLFGQYGRYDNGNQVFNYYDNFMNSGMLTGWNTGTATATANNGLTVTCTGNSGSYALCGVAYGSSPFTQPYIAESNMSAVTRNWGFGLITTNVPNSATQQFNPVMMEYLPAGAPYYYIYYIVTGGQNPTSSSWGASKVASGIYQKFRITAWGTNIIGNATSIPTNNIITNWGDNVPGYLAYGSTSTNDKGTAYWVRVRAYPPSGVMPTQT